MEKEREAKRRIRKTFQNEQQQSRVDCSSVEISFGTVDRTDNFTTVTQKL